MRDESGSRKGIWRGMDCMRDDRGCLKGMGLEVRGNRRVGECLRYV